MRLNFLIVIVFAFFLIVCPLISANSLRITNETEAAGADSSDPNAKGDDAAGADAEGADAGKGDAGKTPPCRNRYATVHNLEVCNVVCCSRSCFQILGYRYCN